MSLPAEWVDYLFAKLTVRYGRAFLRQYEELDLAHVKADWREVLDGFAGNTGALVSALQFVPPDSPPSALQFRAIARSVPAAPAPALPAPRVDPEIARAAAEKMREAAAALRDRAPTALRRRNSEAQACIDRIESITAGGKPGRAQIEQVKACLTVPGTVSRLFPGGTWGVVDATPVEIRRACEGARGNDVGRFDEHGQECRECGAWVRSGPGMESAFKAACQRVKAAA